MPLLEKTKERQKEDVGEKAGQTREQVDLRIQETCLEVEGAPSCGGEEDDN